MSRDESKLRGIGLSIDECRKMMGLPPLPPKVPRRCLHCGREFKSSGPHHRHCQLCRYTRCGLTGDD